jgi:glycerol-3-phosphate acyltransferase PlsY
MSWSALSAALVGGYLLGSVSFAVIVSRLMGLSDPRSYGSRNPGATNVLRTGNKAAAVLTLTGDALKGVLAVLLAQRYGPAYGVEATGIAFVGLAAFVGHLYPVFFRFQGGKGVATFFGVVLVLVPWLGVVAGVAWLLVAAFLRYSSLASLVAAGLVPLGYAFVVGFDGTLVALLGMAGLLALRHQQNIANLMAGKERKLGQKSREPHGARH